MSIQALLLKEQNEVQRQAFINYWRTIKPVVIS